ncbi:MAG: protein-export chaperone SecB [Pseudomonadales bacterium]
MADEQQPGQQFGLQRIYTRDVSFEAPEGPNPYAQQWQPKMNLDLNAKNTKIDAEHFEVVLTLTLTAKHEEATAYLVEVQQAGVFMCKGIEDQQLHQVLGSLCPSILFPYAREMIDSMVVKGGFPAVMLAPINFDAFYQQALERAQKQQQGQQAEQPEPPPTH